MNWVSIKTLLNSLGWGSVLYSSSKTLLESIGLELPSELDLENKTVSFLMLVYGGVFIVMKIVKEVSSTWKQNQMDRIEVKTAKENLEQEKLDTDKKKQELKK